MGGVHANLVGTSGLGFDGEQTRRTRTGGDRVCRRCGNGRGPSHLTFSWIAGTADRGGPPAAGRIRCTLRDGNVVTPVAPSFTRLGESAARFVIRGEQHDATHADVEPRGRREHGVGRTA